MGTSVAFSTPAATGKEQHHQFQQLVFHTMQEDNDRLSCFLAESDISRLNAAAGSDTPTVIDRETHELLTLALKIAAESGGAFDPTVAPLMHLWGFRSSTRTADYPTPEALAAALDRVGWQHLTLSPATAAPPCSAALQLTGMGLDLGAIAKGYTVDRACEALLAAGATDFLVNLAGNMRSHGRPAPKRAAWRIAIRDPLHDDHWLGAITLAANEGIATSGNYEQYVVIDGVRHTHIIDPRSGMPVTGLISLTVVASSATEADALSTALFVLGVDGRHELLAHHPGCGAIYLTDATPPRLLVTAALHQRFTPAPAWQTALTLIE